MGKPVCVNCSTNPEALKIAKKLKLDISKGSSHWLLRCPTCNEPNGIGYGSGSLAPGAKKRLESYFKIHPNNCKNNEDEN